MEGPSADKSVSVDPRGLVCLECGEVAAGRAWRWRMYLSIENELGAYCPECAKREFGRRSGASPRETG